MNQLYILLLTLWSAFNSAPAWEADELTSPDPSPILLDGDPEDNVWDFDVSDSLDFKDWQNLFSDENSEDEDWGVPEPSITVYRQMEDREHVIVLCKSATMSRRMYRRQSFELSVKSELNYTTEILAHSFLDSSEMYMVTVSPPASFTCVLEHFDGDFRNLSSQTYNYSVSVSDHREEGVSSLYICFSSFIAVGLFFMIAAVIVTNIRSKTKDTDFIAVTNNDYVEV